MRLVATVVAIVLAALPVVASADPQAARIESGRRLFQRCASCHTVGPNAVNGFGPQLNGIVGRKAGSAAGYAYSPALRASRIVWDAPTLAAFIRDSDKVVPGNKMRFFSFMSEKQAADIVDYLASTTQKAGARAGATRP